MLNLDAKSRSKLVWIATLLAPVVVVQGVRFTTNTSAAAASAASIAPPVPDAPALAAAVESEKSMTPAQREAVKWLAARSGSAGHRSPMDRADVQPEPPRDTTAASPMPPVLPDVEKPTDEAPRGLTLTGMIAGGPGTPSLCTINHRIQHIGDEVFPSWRISRIDGRNRVVVLTGPEGRTALISPPTPSLEQ